MRTERITKVLKEFDRKLFCKAGPDGVKHVFRESFKEESYALNDEGDVIRFRQPFPAYIMSLTHNWSRAGNPVDWGLEPLMRRMREIDGWNDDAPVNHLKEQMEHAEISKKRDFLNETEAFLKDFRPQFAKTFSDVNTANMNKIDKRRIKNGHR